jgi:CIC family chloride channel protein
MRQKVTLLGLVLLTGVLGGLAGVCFHFLLIFVLRLLYQSSDVVGALEGMPVWLVLLLPAIGGLLTGLLIRFSNTPEVAGEGVPAIKRAIGSGESLVRYRVAPLKMAATMLTIGSGGSGGREGPIIQIGAALGSLVGQLGRTSVSVRETLLLCGAAAAMAATFGTPVAALVFVAEVLRRMISFRQLVALSLAVLVAVIVATVIFQYEGLRIPQSIVIDNSIPTLFFAVVVGILSGFIAVTFGWSLKSVRQTFAISPIPNWFRPAIGGLLVGCLLVWLPMLHEAALYSFGSEVVSGAPLSIGLLFSLIVFKIVATALTVGSGGSGGIFAPTLFIGLVVGALVYHTATAMGYGVTSQLMIVGMAALFAGAAHAPVTAIFMLYELTEKVQLLPSLIIASMVAYGVARLIRSENVYTNHT